MAFDGIAERTAIYNRAKTLAGGRVYKALVDDSQIPKDAQGYVKPYIVINFGALYQSYEGRSIAGEREQPFLFPVTFECWGLNDDVVAPLVGAVRSLFLGWSAGPNMSEMRFSGGYSFPIVDTNGRPVRVQESVTMLSVLNLDPERS